MNTVYTFTTKQPIREMVAAAIVRAELAKVRLYAVLKWVLDNAKRILSRVKVVVATVLPAVKYSDYLTNYDNEWPARPYISQPAQNIPPSNAEYVPTVLRDNMLIPVASASEIRTLADIEQQQRAKTERYAQAWKAQAATLAQKSPAYDREKSVSLSNVGKPHTHRP